MQPVASPKQIATLPPNGCLQHGMQIYSLNPPETWWVRTRFGGFHYMAHEESNARVARMMQGMRYQKGGKDKYWLPKNGKADDRTPLLSDNNGQSAKSGVHGQPAQRSIFARIAARHGRDLWADQLSDPLAASRIGCPSSVRCIREPHHRPVSA